jgi:hypothetical protein
MRLDRSRARRTVAGVASLAAVVVAVVSLRVFPYHSSNHDEGVYLQHAEMLLSGRLRMRTGELTEAFRPWFFVADGGTVYPKYTPVTSAIFAAGDAVYSYRAALVVVAAANVVLVYAVAAEAFDRRVGLLSSAALLFSPLFVVQSSLFLSYAPTTALNLGFALAYLRAWRHRSVRYAALAGVCAGLAFFSRQYTAVVFAAPFVLHAAYTVLSDRDRATVYIYATTAGFGLAFVALALAYNRVMTGDLFVFPYLEFAPNDGVGFGRREILGYSRLYTPELALRANARVLYRFALDWGPGGLVGIALGLVGAARALYDRRTGPLLVVAVAVSVVVGNVLFWGNLNILGEIPNPDDGLIHLYGTHYHFDLLLPACVLAAVGVATAYEGLSERLDRRAATAAVLVFVVAFAGVGTANTATKMDENLGVTESYEAAYEPFDDGGYEGVVFLPTPYGDWLNHPFQYLRNDADLNGTTVYALDHGDENFEVVDAYPERDLYRYAYRGEWSPTSGASVEAVVRELRTVEGETVELETRIPAPDRATSVVATLRGDEGSVYTTVERGGNTTVVWGLNETHGFLRDAGAVEVDDEGELTLEITVTRRYDSFSYRQELSYEAGEAVRVIAPPYTERCYSYERCGGEAAVVDGSVTTEAVATTPERVP